jgi:hypothetical protein
MNTIKRSLLLLLCLVLIADVTYAQLYFRAGTGYAFPWAGESRAGDGTFSGNYNNSIQTLNSGIVLYSFPTFVIKQASYSSGYHGSLGVGYLFNPHFGLQLDADLGIANSKLTFNIEDLSGKTTITRQASHPVMLLPSIVMQTGGEVFNGYCRFGTALPVRNQVAEKIIFTDAAVSGGKSYEYNADISNTFSLGITAATGIQYKFNSRLSIWGEVSMLSMSLFIKEADGKSFTINGISQPLPPNIKYTRNGSFAQAEQAAYQQPYSNLGINVGISYSLAKPAHTETVDNSSQPQ